MGVGRIPVAELGGDDRPEPRGGVAEDERLSARVETEHRAHFDGRLGRPSLHPF